MKVTSSLPDDVFTAAEDLAKRLGISRSELYSNAVASFVEHHRTQGVTERLDQVYAEVPSEVDAELQTLQLGALPEEVW